MAREESRIEKNIKSIIDCVKKKRMAYSDLQKATGIPPRTLSRMLGYLEHWGIILKDKTSQWTWFERTRTYETRQDLDVAVSHSKELIKGLKFVMFSLEIPERFRGPAVGGLSDVDARILKEAAEEHLRTGYEEVYAEIADFRSLMVQRDGLAQELRKFGRDTLKLLNEIYYFRCIKHALPKKEWKRLKKIVAEIPEEKLAAIDKIQKSKAELFNKLAGDVEYLIKKIENYEPLEGRCRLCPNVKVSAN